MSEDNAPTIARAASRAIDLSSGAAGIRCSKLNVDRHHGFMITLMQPSFLARKVL
jgi:hypothetical protein